LLVRLLTLLEFAWVALSAAPSEPGPGEPNVNAPSIAASLSCPKREEPGRVVCDLTLKTESEPLRIVWADVLVIDTPSFVSTLRARVTTKVPDQGSSEIGVPVAFVARELGRARVTLQARAVLCRAPKTTGDRGAPVWQGCLSASRRIMAEMQIGR